MSEKPETAKREPRPNEIALKQPIKQAGGEDIEFLELRKPAPGELRGLQLAQLAMGDVAQLSKLIPRISAPPITEADVAAMDLADFTSCYEKVGIFLGN